MREPVNYSAKPAYVETIRRVEVLHRQLLDLVKAEFDRMCWDDINPTQALMMFHLGADEMPSGDLRARGLYSGTNASYNLSKLVAGGYLSRRQGKDRREVWIKLTPKGEEVAEVVDELLDRHIENGLAGIDAINSSMGELERFWTLQSGMIGRRA